MWTRSVIQKTSPVHGARLEADDLSALQISNQLGTNISAEVRRHATSVHCAFILAVDRASIIIDRPVSPVTPVAPLDAMEGQIFYEEKA